MGIMLDGKWYVDEPAGGTDASGRFERQRSTIRNWITPDGSAGPEGVGGFAPDAGRYHLYVAWNCPWAHRALLTRAMLGLQGDISVSFARPRRTDQGWVFDDSGEYADAELGVSALHEVFQRQPAPYTGRVTMPILWDRETQQIVTNESADLVRMFGQVLDPAQRLCPPDKLTDIERWNAAIYPKLNNGVYRTGFARTQAAYDEAVADVFEMLDEIEAQLAHSACLTGDHVTEADIRLFPTLARFDVAYHYAFKCNIRRIADYPNLWDYARAFYQLPGIANTVRFWVYKQGYFSPSELRNPLGIVPAGPKIDWDTSTERHLSLAAA